MISIMLRGGLNIEPCRTLNKPIIINYYKLVSKFKSGILCFEVFNKCIVVQYLFTYLFDTSSDTLSKALDSSIT